MSYTLLDGGKAIRCDRCNKVSHNANDVAERYCGYCHKWHDGRLSEVGEQRLYAPIWTIYDHPSDYPDCFVARAYPIGSLEPDPNEPALTAATVEELRKKVQARARFVLDCLPRDHDDDPCVVESWL